MPSTRDMSRKNQTIDLSSGSPTFLEPYWDARLDANLHIESSENMSYPPQGGTQSLIKAIRALHRATGNANHKAKHVVVGNGASQILFGLFSAMRDTRGATQMWIPPTYWFRVPRMASYLKLQTFETDAELPDTKSAIKWHAYPANPDTTRARSYWVKDRNAVLDLAYYWPQYTALARSPIDAPVQVFSLSKATGHAGTRVGWALLEDDALAYALSGHVENTTCGVSLDGQRRAEHVIDRHLATPPGGVTFMEYGQDILRTRWAAIIRLPNLPFRILNREGMFAWCEVVSLSPAKKMMLDRYGITVLDGRTCGGHEYNFRINMGCSDEDFAEAIERLQG